MYIKLSLAILLAGSAALNIYQFGRYQYLAKRVYLVRTAWLHPSDAALQKSATDEREFWRQAGGVMAVVQLPDFQIGQFKFVGNVLAPIRDEPCTYDGKTWYLPRDGICHPEDAPH